MQRMTSTLTPPPGHPDPDSVAVRPQDPDLSGTRTALPTQTPHYSDPDPDRSERPDSDPDGYPDPDPGPDATQTRTQTPTRTGYPDSAHVRFCGEDDLDESDPDDTRTRTRTRTQTRAAGEREVHVRQQVARAISYPGGWLARRRAAGEARRRAVEIAIQRGVEAELLLLEAQAGGEISEEEPRARWEQFAAGWPQTLLTIAVAIIASVGQIQFAKEKGAVGMIWLFSHDITPFFAPTVLDLSVAALYARGMYVAVRYQASPWLPWAAGTVIGAFSVYTNTKHEHGALLFAGASAVGVISWMVALLLKYWNLPHVKERRTTAKPRLLTSSLVFASRATASRAWTISRRRPIASCAATMTKNGTKTNERDLVIRAAELFNTVYHDRLIAELELLPDPPAKDAGREALAAWRGRRDQAVTRADIVAWDAVDTMLGLPVIEREGIRVNRVSYVEPTPPPAPARRQVVSAPSAPELPASPPRRRTELAQRRPDPEVVIVERPPGNKYRNWVRLADIPGLPPIDPDIRCECGPDAAGRCGESLMQHVERRGEQIRDFVAAAPTWATRPARISKPDVAVLGLGAGASMELVWLMNQLRGVAAAQEGTS